jgi:hypothetical protein
LLGVAGSAYSVERSLPTVADPAGVASGAVGQLGFGLFCRRPGASWYSSGSEDPAVEWSCGMFCGVRGDTRVGNVRGVRVVALARGVLPGRWTHLAGTYASDGGGLCGLTVDGVAAAAVTAPGGLLYSPDPALFAVLVTPGQPPAKGVLPDSRMGFGIGRLIMAARANSVAQVFRPFSELGTRAVTGNCPRDSTERNRKSKMMISKRLGRLALDNGYKQEQRIRVMHRPPGSN